MEGYYHLDPPLHIKIKRNILEKINPGKKKMPNWCNTEVYVKGSKEDIDKMQKILDNLSERPTSLIKNGFGNLWLGNLVTRLGVHWKDVFCRGYIYEYLRLNNTTLNLSIESTWHEPDQVFDVIEKKFKSTEIYYRAEEGGLSYYRQYDPEHKYFNRYVLRSSSGVYETSDNIEDFAKTFPGEIIKTKEDIVRIIEDMEEFEFIDFDEGDSY